MEEFVDEQIDQPEAHDTESGDVPSMVRAEVPDGPRIRLDAFLSSATGESRSRIKKLVEEGHCRVDGACCTDADLRLRPGQVTEIALPVPQSVPAAEDGPLDIVHCDADIAVINKPAGLTMHPCPSCPGGTLVNRLMARFPQLAFQEGPRPGVVHRLDKDTSGLVVIALSERARLRLTQAFAARKVHKTYLAITRGVPSASGESALPIGRHPTQKTRMAVVSEAKGGRSARTCWNTLYADPEGKAALLAVRIFTGRTHQIRVHLSQAGYPLLGDGVYGPYDPLGPARRQMLHAWKLDFVHPVTGMAMAFCCPPPSDFTRVLLAMDKGMEIIILTGMPGCGKSAVLRLLAQRGMPAWSADGAVAELYEPGSEGWSMLRMRWGDAFFDDSGAVDRAKLTAMLAGNPEMRRELEGIIHPLARERMLAFFERAKRGGYGAVAAEVPLWFESSWKKPVRATVVAVSCPDDIRHERLMRDRGWSSEKIFSVESWQWSAKAKAEAADYVMPNAGSMGDLDREADALLEHLHKKRAARRRDLVDRLRLIWNAD